MDFGETLLAAQRNQHQPPQENVYYRAKFEPPKKEQKPAARLSANIQKFLAKKEEEERRKQLEVKRKRDELLAMRDPKATRKIQKMLKVIKSANKSVLEEATDLEHTAVTRTGAEQPDQDDYGYESQEAAAIYQKMMEKYSKLPEEEKFPSRGSGVKKDLEGTRERMRQALKLEEEPQPRHRKRKSQHSSDKEDSPPPQPEKKPEKEKPKFRKPLPPPIDFNQLLKLAEQKKSEPVALLAPVKKAVEPESERPMTKKQKREFEEEQARREARLRRMQEAEKAEKAGCSKQDRPRSESEKSERKSESTPTFTRIPKLSDKVVSAGKSGKSTMEVTKKPVKEEPRKIDRDRSSYDTTQNVPKFEEKKKIDLKSQNTYRIEKSSIENKLMKPRDDRKTNRHDDYKPERDDNRYKPNNRDNDRYKPNRDDDRYKPNNRDNDHNEPNRDDDHYKRNRDNDRYKSNRDENRYKSNRDDDRKLNKVEDRHQPNRDEDRYKTNRDDDRYKPNRDDDRYKPNRDDDRYKPNRDNDRYKPNRDDDHSISNRENDRKPNRDNDHKPNRNEDHYKPNRDDNRYKPNRDTDRKPNTDNESKNKRDDDRKANRDDDRKANRDDNCKANRDEDRYKPNRDDERMKVRAGERSNGQSSQNKVMPKQTQENSRKVDIKNKVLAKERMLFGSGRNSPKVNGSITKPETSKLSKPIEQTPRELPKQSKMIPNNNKKVAPSNINAKSQPSTNKAPSKTFDFDKHVNSLKKPSGMDQRDEKDGKSVVVGGVKRQNGPRQFPPADVKRKLTPGDVRSKNLAPKRRMIDSESEYDSELDDFIDDGDDEADYSKHIKEIFGYDKSRYRDMDDDDAGMESSFAQQMREEYISKKIGIMEDLEDMRQEALEKKRTKKKRRISDDDD